jgi:hypothetical protein
MSDHVASPFWSTEYETLVENALESAPVLAALRHGELPAGDPTRLVVRHYAEVRTALDFKLPNRLRLCPADAYVAKKFFWRLYAEEQGDFDPNQNHASLFAGFCRRLGVTDEDMETEFQAYWPHYRYMLTDEPSHEVLVRELTISCVWESVILRLGSAYLSAIGQAFDLDAEALRYFTVHQTADAHHSVAALKVLRHYASTMADLELVRATIHDTLVTANPWTIKLTDGVDK